MDCDGIFCVATLRSVVVPIALQLGLYRLQVLSVFYGKGRRLQSYDVGTLSMCIHKFWIWHYKNEFYHELNSYKRVLFETESLQLLLCWTELLK